MEGLKKKTTKERTQNILTNTVLLLLPCFFSGVMFIQQRCWMYPCFGIHAWMGLWGSCGVPCHTWWCLHSSRGCEMPGPGFGREKHPPKMPWRNQQILQLPGRMFHVLTWTCSSSSLPFPRLCCCFGKVGQDLLNINLS